ncbi:hypothetical protein [Alicyclobacillus mali]|uniref:hypothetical protein n=1 Tax=Alicyclobacillus mali (ex Roth et al. 2021) TaxID=1123961 RepID=UPI001A8DA3C4
MTIDKGSFLVTHTDGNPLDTPIPVSDLYIAPAERYDIVITPPQTGKWYLRSKIAGQETVRIPFYTQGQVSEGPPPAR